MKNITKIVLSLILTLALVVVPVAGNNYEAAEADATTQGVITCVNMYDYNFGATNDIIAFASYDDTQTLSTLTGQDEATFAWFYNALLEYDEAKGAWVVTNADLEMDGVNANANTTLGAGKMVVMFHDQVTARQQASFDFFKANFVNGKELYLGVHESVLFDVYDYVDGAFLSTVPVEVAEPEPETEATDDKDDAAADDKDAAADDKDAADDKEAGMNPLVIAVIAVVVVAVVAVVAVVIKRKK